MATTSLKLQKRPYLSATEDFALGKDSPRAFLERCLELMAAIEPEVMAFEATDLDGARAAADAATGRWKAGHPLSPIDGMPIGVKDIIETGDMPTGMGSPLFDGYQPRHDAASVRALREAGAAVVGKTVTTEFAATEPGKTRNPFDSTRTPGGSSSGSAAAVGSGMLSAALGTQVVGSIVRPSSYCGVYGFKPSLGAINRGGSLDILSQSVQGVLAASLEDAWGVAYAAASRCGGDPGYDGLIGSAALPNARKAKRLAMLETPGWDVAEDAAKAALLGAVETLAKAGIEIVTRKQDKDIDLMERALVEALDLTRRINAYESRWPLNVFHDQDASKLSKAMRDRLAQSIMIKPEQHRDALRRRVMIRAQHAALADRFDACITLSATGPAPKGMLTGDPVFAVPGSMLAVPALSLPIFEVAGMPLGLQVLGFMGEDAAAMSLAGGILAILNASTAA
jgi:Asp-tRNA(Asn)/Glu-tRNA(Gln) amidotransferase A subunit family amidase